MNQRLFIELYLDEDVDILIADLLRGYGFIAETTRDAGQLGSSDMANWNTPLAAKRPCSPTTGPILRCWRLAILRPAKPITA